MQSLTKYRLLFAACLLILTTWAILGVVWAFFSFDFASDTLEVIALVGLVVFYGEMVVGGAWLAGIICPGRHN